MTRKRGLYTLRRPKLRQSWNKYNLYNFWRQRDPRIGNRDSETFFQQKWRAKGLLRAYHGEHIKEGVWQRMFSRRLLSVANMDPRYMAQFDGSEMASGRGSGKINAPVWAKDTMRPNVLTPYMNMAFAPMERRLDIAVFRAMFASSVRQARQFCVHGGVKVNGMVMHYPAYRLNPGDMFQVNSDFVMYATGQPKPSKDDLNASRRVIRKPAKSKEGEEEQEEPEEDEEEDAENEDDEGGLSKSKQKKEVGTDKAEGDRTKKQKEDDAAAATAEEAAPHPDQDPETTDEPEMIGPDMKPTKEAIKNLTTQAKILIQGRDIKAKQKQKLRAFIRTSKSLLSKAGKRSVTPEMIAKEISDTLQGLQLVETPPKEEEGGEEQQRKENSEMKLSPQALENPLDYLQDYERHSLEAMIRAEEENPRDPSKPYKTPWKPRHFMSPFAFIPRYLEVNQNICAAVYLRHPVARVGSAEVPTPFGYRINQLAHNWYLRRR